MVSKTYKLKNGRILSYEMYGDLSQNGIPVIFSHGLSDSRLLKHYDDEVTKKLGVQIIAVDQPGVGLSTNVVGVKDRTILSYAKDIQELVDEELRLNKFAVAGHSGGGPHALAVAYLMKDRVTCGVLAAPAPPLLDPYFDTFKIPFAKFVIKTLICQWFSFLLHGLSYLLAWYGNRNIENYIEVAAESDRTSGNPETFLGNPKQTQVFKDSFTAGLVQGSKGIQGMFQAVFINGQDWGFDVHNDIPQHFDVFMSEQDSIMKPELGQRLAENMTNASCHVWPNAGHYSFVDPQCWTEFYTAIVRASKEIKQSDT